MFDLRSWKRNRFRMVVDNDAMMMMGAAMIGSAQPGHAHGRTTMVIGQHGHDVKGLAQVMKHISASIRAHFCHEQLDSAYTNSQYPAPKGRPGWRR